MLSRFSNVRLFVTPRTVAYQVPLSMGFSRQEYWSGLSCPSPGDLPDPWIKLGLLSLLYWEADSLPLAPSGSPTLEIITKETNRWWRNETEQRRSPIKDVLSSDSQL